MMMSIRISLLLLLMLASPVGAAVTIAPPSLIVNIPSNQATATGTIVASNSGPGSVTVTWKDSMNCLVSMNSPGLTRTIAAGASTNLTMTVNCAQSGTATLTGTGVSILIPVVVTKGAAPVPGPAGTPTVLMKTSPVLGSALIGWNANTESDLAGYRVYMGTAPKTYTSTTVLQKDRTTATANNLQPGKTYYFAVSAFDLSNNESGKSNEVFKAIP